MSHVIKAQDLSRLRCQKCGEKPSLDARTGKKGMIYLARCKCHAAVLFVHMDDYKAWHAKEYGYEIGDGSNGK